MSRCHANLKVSLYRFFVGDFVFERDMRDSVTCKRNNIYKNEIVVFVILRMHEWLNKIILMCNIVFFTELH